MSFSESSWCRCEARPVRGGGVVHRDVRIAAPGHVGPVGDDDVRQRQVLAADLRRRPLRRLGVAEHVGQVRRVDVAVVQARDRRALQDARAGSGSLSS